MVYLATAYRFSGLVMEISIPPISSARDLFSFTILARIASIATDSARCGSFLGAVLVTRVNLAKTAELNDLPAGGQTFMGPRNHVLDEI